MLIFDILLSDVRLSDVRFSNVCLSDVRFADICLFNVCLSDVCLDVCLSDVRLSNVRLSDIFNSKVGLPDAARIKESGHVGRIGTDFHSLDRCRSNDFLSGSIRGRAIQKTHAHASLSLLAEELRPYSPCISRATPSDNWYYDQKRRKTFFFMSNVKKTHCWNVLWYLGIFGDTWCVFFLCQSYQHIFTDAMHAELVHADDCLDGDDQWRTFCRQGYSAVKCRFLLIVWSYNRIGHFFGIFLKLFSSINIAKKYKD